MLGARIASAVVLVPSVLFLLWFSIETTAVLAVAGGIIGTYEFYNMAAHAQPKFKPLYLAGFILAGFLAYAAYRDSFLLMLAAMGLFAIYTGIAISLRDSIGSQILQIEGGPPVQPPTWNWLLTVFAPIYVGLPLSLLVLIRYQDGNQNLSGWIWLALIGTWGTDTAAFFAGRWFGKHKLAPTISPKKTIEGAIGGVIFGIIGAVLVGYLALNQPWYLTVPLGFAIALASILGDLFESWVKRRFDTKDSGNLIPGHGGLLDRIDSFLVVCVLVYIFFSIARL